MSVKSSILCVAMTFWLFYNSFISIYPSVIRILKKDVMDEIQTQLPKGFHGWIFLVLKKKNRSMSGAPVIDSSFPNQFSNMTRFKVEHQATNLFEK